jgi:hypothetical protein
MKNEKHFLLRDDEIEQFIIRKINREAEIRDIERDEKEKFFFDWDLIKETYIKRCISFLISEVYQATLSVNIEINMIKRIMH